jgi:hypothetical protein
MPVVHHNFFVIKLIEDLAKEFLLALMIKDKMQTNQKVSIKN